LGARFGRLVGKIRAKYRSGAGAFTSALSLKYLGRCVSAAVHR
jgi:hypothetical protein